MDATILRHNGKLCGVYLDNGILLDAREGIGSALKEHGLQPKTVLLTSMAGEPVAGLSELEGVPIGNAGIDESCTVTQFPVGSKGDRKYGFRIKAFDGELVYAPKFDRLERGKIAGADMAILDPGDRSEVGDPAGLSHKSFIARERMATNAGVGLVVWTDWEADGLVSTLKKTAADLNDSERTALRNKARESGQSYEKLVRMYIHALESYEGMDKKPDVPKQQYAMGAVNNNLSRKKAYEPEECEEGDEDCKKKMKQETQEKSVDLDEQISAIGSAFRSYDFGLPMDTRSMYIVKNYDDAIVVCHYGEHYDDMEYYRIGYSKSGDSFTFDPPSSWKEVEMTSAFTPVEKSSFLITKEQDDVLHWMSISSSTFRDAEGEVVSPYAMDFAIAVNKARGTFGDLVWEHYEELPIGKCTNQMRVGEFLVEEGHFYNTVLGRQAATKLKSADPGMYRVSIGFNYWNDTRSDDGVYSLIDIRHRATTTRPSNPATSIEVVKTMAKKQLTPEALARVAKDLELPETTVKEILEQLSSNKSKEEQTTETALKETEAPKAEAPKTEAPPATEAPKADASALDQILDAIKSVGDRVTALEKNATASAEKTRNDLASILGGAPKSTVVRPTATGTEVTQSEKAEVAKEVQEAAKSGTPLNDMPQALYNLFTSQSGK